MSSVQVVLLEPARVVLAQIGQFLINVLLVIIILIVGWLISKAIKTIVTNGLRALKLDELSDRIELDSMLEKGGIAYSLSELIGVVCYWLALLVTFVVALGTVNLITASLLDKIVSYIPNVIAAIFILILGLFVATFLRNIVQAAASNAGLSQSKMLSQLVSVIIIIFSVLIALEQLQIGIRITELTVSIVLGSIGLGLALAFGLGCKGIAEKFVSDVIDKVKSKK